MKILSNPNPVITVELNIKDAQLLRQLLAITHNGKKYNMDNTCVYELYSALDNFIRQADVPITQFVNTEKTFIELVWYSLLIIDS